MTPALRHPTCGLVAVLVAAGLAFPTARPVTAQAPAAPAPAAAPLTLAEQEQFLATAKVVASRPVSTGITGTIRATLDDGVRRHDASVQRIDERKETFRAAGGKRETNFRDSWMFNVAGYQVALLLGLDAVPPSVERNYQGDRASYTWWVDDVILDEGTRQEKKIDAPVLRRWEHQVMTMRVFDALIANTDRNKGNLLIDKTWKAWYIDHSRAFRLSHQILDPTPLVRCDRTLLAALRALDGAAVKARASRWITDDQIEAMMARRDAIVARFDKMPASIYTYTP
jgi:hypothetical protein